MQSWINALLGGALIGVSVSLMLVLNGRVTGISGITYGRFSKVPGEAGWRRFFLAGLLGGGLVLQVARPESFGPGGLPADGTVLLAGLLVGFGTILGNGCTSGHGVCGISRLSPRSLAATLVFIAAGTLTVSTLRWIGMIP